jgi:hypothetical protein
MSIQTGYQVIVDKMIHLGDDPLPIGKSIHSGIDFQLEFELPENLVMDDFGIAQCRTLHNQCDNKICLINGNRLENFLNPHPQLTRAWVQDSHILPLTWLSPGKNIMFIGYTDDNRDNFLIDNFILWYKYS